MLQIRLINGGGKTIKVGDPVKLHPTKKNAFDYAELGSVVIGTVSHDTKPHHYAVIVPIMSPDQNPILVEKIIGNIIPAMSIEINKIRGPKIIISLTEPINPLIDDIWIIPSQT